MARPKTDTQDAQSAKTLEQLAADVRAALDAHNEALLAHIDALERRLTEDRAALMSASTAIRS